MKWSSASRGSARRASACVPTANVRLQGKTVVITGASTGIGRASALRFAQEGARLVLADVQDAAGEAPAQAIARSGGTACFVRTDVSRRADNERMIDACVERYGRLDILFCNAGINLPKLLVDSSDEDIDGLLAVNVKGPLYAARHAIPIMLRQPEGGVLLFTASKTGLVAQTDSPVYCASKGAVVLLAKALALDYATRGIRVNALCPGIIDTPMLRRFADAMPDPAAAWTENRAAQPLGRFGTPEECAAAELCVAAVHALAPLVQGLTLEEIKSDMARFWRRLTGDSQLRWVGPEKGVVHLATAALVNAVWDLYAKVEGKPLWQLLRDMTPEELVRCIDFRYLSDALTPQDALDVLAAHAPTRAAREAELRRGGYPAYTTSAGWLGYPDEKIRRLCREGVARGWSHFKIKVGRDLEDDLRRAAVVRGEIGSDRKLMLDARSEEHTSELQSQS